MENFQINVDAQGVALVTFEVPGRSVNVISAAVQRDLDLLVKAIAEDDRIVGAVLQSGKPSGFCVGADLTELPADIARWGGASGPEEIAMAVADAGSFSRRVRALETCGKPVAAVLAGAAIGGGLELALGCHYRVAAADRPVRLSLPEAKLGLMPGGGGTQRLMRLIGLNRAVPAILDGEAIGQDLALESGVVHAFLPEADLVAAARTWVLAAVGAAANPWDVKGFKLPGGGPHGPAGYGQFGPAIAARRGGEAGDSAATGNILKALYEGAQVPIDAGLRIEARYFYKTATTPGVAERIAAFLSKA